jgi:hypothetical protein
MQPWYNADGEAELHLIRAGIKLLTPALVAVVVQLPSS